MGNNYKHRKKEDLIAEIEKLKFENIELKNKPANKSGNSVIQCMHIDQFINSTPIPVQVLNTKGCSIHANPDFEKLFGSIPSADYSIFKDPQFLASGFEDGFEKLKQGQIVYFPNLYYDTRKLNDKSKNKRVFIQTIGYSIKNKSGKPEEYILIYIDKTRQKKSEEELSDSKKMLELVINNIPQYIFWKDCKSVYLGCNENFAKAAGVDSEDDIVGKSDHELNWKSEDADFFQKADKRVIDSGIAECHIISPLLQAGDKMVWFDTNKIPIHNNKGKIIGLLGTYEDITERKYADLLLQGKSKKIESQNKEYIKINYELEKSNLELKVANKKAEENETHFKSLFQNAADAMFIAEIETGIIIDANQAAEYLIQLPIDKIIGLHQSKLHPKENNSFSINTFKKQYEETSDSENSSLVENKVVRTDGSEIFVEIRASKVNYGGKKCLMGIFRDISKRKNAENELLEAKEVAEEKNANITAIIEGTNNSIWAFNKKYEIIYLNNTFKQEFYNSFGIDLQPGSNLVKALPESLQPIWKPRYDRVLANEPFSIEDEVPLGKTSLFIETSFNPIVKKGKVIGGTCFGSNITDRKNGEFELVKAKEKAEESDQLKSAFLQNMSHEIRTPMNAIVGFSDLLIENYGNKIKLERFSNIINSRCRDLLDIINDILDISKIESGQVVLNYEECDIIDLFADLYAFFNEQKIKCNKFNIELSFKFENDKSCAFVITDMVKLKQILINLIGNAFKFTETGKIHVRCKIEKNKLHFLVADTGIGIPKRKHKHIFERFTQLNNPAIKNIGGTGLGLSIAKRLANMMGGDMWVESDADCGVKDITFSTAFHFTINHIISTQKHLETEKIPGLKTYNFTEKNLLIVEDDTYNSLYLQEILNNTGFNIFSTGNANEALEIASSNLLDIVLMDIRLPDASGLEATREILKVKPDLKIIAQTAYASTDDKKKALASGCIDYIAKPIKRDALLTLINKHM